MKRIFLATLAAGMTIAPAGFAAPPSSPFLLRHGVIIDSAGGAGYIAKPNSTIDAVDLASGRTLWTSAEGALPIGLDQNLLVAQVEEKPRATERFHLAILDAAGGRRLSEATITLPDGVRALVADDNGTSFRATAEREGALFLVSWYYRENLVHAIAPNPTDPMMLFFAGSARINSQTGKIVTSDGGQVTDAPGRWNRYGSPPAAPWQTGSVSARTEGGRGGPLTLKRADAAGKPLPDQVLSRQALFGVASADQHHLLASERVGDGTPDNPEYRWVVFSIDTAARTSELRSEVSAAPFFVFSDSLIFESRPHGYLRAGVQVDEPLTMQAVRLSTGVPQWKVELRDLSDRGHIPPAR
jgi:hypothetical protein